MRSSSLSLRARHQISTARPPYLTKLLAPAAALSLSYWRTSEANIVEEESIVIRSEAEFNGWAGDKAAASRRLAARVLACPHSTSEHLRASVGRASGKSRGLPRPSSHLPANVPASAHLQGKARLKPRRQVACPQAHRLCAQAAAPEGRRSVRV